jgi:cation diffusion facilitator CzcD-associated flavoprotein CzcO
MLFNTELLSADWDHAQGVWNVITDVGIQFTARYLIMAVGLLSRPNYPDIPGIDTYRGRLCHTTSWTNDIDVKNKRVGVIGCGSTGVQVITEIAQDVKTLYCFQRHPQYSVPNGDRPVSPEYRAKVNANYDQIMAQVRESKFGFGIVESETPFESVPEEKREEIFESLWNQGGGFRFMSSGFSDVSFAIPTPRAAEKNHAILFSY